MMAVSKQERVLAAVAEYPGVEVTAAEIGIECGMTSREVSKHLYNLVKRGHIKHRTCGVGRAAYYWVEAQP